MVRPEIEIHDGLPEKLKANLRISRSVHGRRVEVPEETCRQWHERHHRDGESFATIAEDYKWAARTICDHVRGRCCHSHTESKKS